MLLVFGLWRGEPGDPQTPRGWLVLGLERLREGLREEWRGRLAVCWKVQVEQWWSSDIRWMAVNLINGMTVDEQGE